MLRNIVANSAAGIATQAPVTPKICGRISKNPTINNNVRANEIHADAFPFESAVKNPEETRFTPLNRKFTAKILNPASARANVSGSFVNTDTIGVASIMEADVIAIEEMTVNKKEIRYIFRSSLRFPAPYW